MSAIKFAKVCKLIF